MLGLGIWEIVIILVTALVVLGPDKLPQVARQLARLLGELRRVSDEVRRNFDDVMAEPVDPRRHDAPRPLPAGAQAAHSGAAPGASELETAAQPSAPKDAEHAAQSTAQAARTGAHLTQSERGADAAPASETSTS